MEDKKINEIVNETVKKFISSVIEENSEYKMRSLDELYGYMWLKPAKTGINADIFVDDGEAYIRDQHVPLIYVRNGYGREITEFIPISISGVPRVLDRTMKINLDMDVLRAIINFIKINRNALLAMADGKIGVNEFSSALKIPSQSVVESKQPINEMATLRRKDSNLPMDIWLDEGATFQGHAPRIKFRASKEQKNTDEFSSMTLTNPPVIENFPRKHNVSTKDIRALREFVIMNMDLLLKLANGEIDYQTEFLPNMIKV